MKTLLKFNAGREFHKKINELQSHISTTPKKTASLTFLSAHQGRVTAVPAALYGCINNASRPLQTRINDGSRKLKQCFSNSSKPPPETFHSTSGTHQHTRDARERVGGCKKHATRQNLTGNALATFQISFQKHLNTIAKVLRLKYFDFK